MMKNEDLKTHSALSQDTYRAADEAKAVEPRPITTNSDPRADIPARTPSPTPSEAYVLTHKSGKIDWELFKSKKYWGSPRALQLVVGITVFVAVSVLFALFNTQIVNGVRPATNWCRQHTAGWLIPVALLVILSFPPLFGHEFIGLMCGIGWGLGTGFGILAFGTLPGEVASFYILRCFCTGRYQKYEKKNISFGCLSRVVRENGFIVAVAARLSILPAHLTTGLFACTGMSFPIFLAATICSLPKQLVLVVSGVVMAVSADKGSSTKIILVNVAISVVTSVITSLTMRYINKKVEGVKEQIIYERRKARQVASETFGKEDA